MVIWLGDLVGGSSNSHLKMSAQQDWAGIATDGRIRADAVYQKLGRSGLEESHGAWDGACWIWLGR